MNPAPKVMVVDDDSGTRALLRRMFMEASIAVETFGSAAELLDNADLRPPAVLVLDVMMPGMSGLTLHGVLRERGVALPVIFLSGSADVAMAVTAMRNGAADFLEKTVDNDALVGRVHEIFARSAAPFAQQARQRNPAVARRLATLTPRQHEVYELMITGKSSKMIARDLDASFRTIETHRRTVMGKMGAAKLADLVRMAFDTGSDA
jgi:two-component system response regulator FixJ